MPKTLEFWFDFSCPYAYLASARVEAIAARAGAALVPCPMLLGGVFEALGQPQQMAATMSAPKARHNAADMRRFAALFQVPLRIPAGHPLRTVLALRALLATGELRMSLIHRFYRAYWVEGEDLSERSVVARILTDQGHDAGAVLARAETQEVKDELRRRTDRALELGIFGAPTCVVDGDIYWGQDRLHFVEEALGGSPEPFTWPNRLAHPVDFFFDYSSPFASLAAMRLAGSPDPGLTWRPMLLGAVFKAVSTDNVPMFSLSPPKRRYQAQDMKRQADRIGVPFKWPSRFPMRTVLPLRVTLAAECHRQLVDRLARAYWCEDRDISDPATVAGLADEVGLPGTELVAQAEAHKDALFESTERAIHSGVFGAPGFVVRPPTGEPQVYWGADRLELALMAASGRNELL
jgi:2-hydroxychromene-2-carboxylate isomerase